MASHIPTRCKRIPQRSLAHVHTTQRMEHMNDFLERMKALADKGIEASKGMLDQAGETVKDLSEKGVTKMEVHQLEKQVQKQFTELGLEVFDLLVMGEKKTISLKDEKVLSIIEEVKSLKNELRMREDKLKAI